MKSCENKYEKVLRWKSPNKSKSKIAKSCENKYEKVLRWKSPNKSKSKKIVKKLWKVAKNCEKTVKSCEKVPKLVNTVNKDDHSGAKLSKGPPVNFSIKSTHPPRTDKKCENPWEGVKIVKESVSEIVARQSAPYITAKRQIMIGHNTNIAVYDEFEFSRVFEYDLSSTNWTAHFAASFQQRTTW